MRHRNEHAGCHDAGHVAHSTHPKANADPNYVAAKRARLGEPHIAPLTWFVQQIRDETGKEVPDFDPDMGGTHARALFLLESPGRLGTSLSKARGSGLISPDNNDQTAAESWRLYREAALDQQHVVVWNIVPWYLGSDAANAHPTTADLHASMPHLTRLLDLLPDLRVVLTVGRDAERGWAMRTAPRGRPEPPAITCPHPGPTNIRTRPETRGRILDALRAVQRIIGPNDSGDLPVSSA